MVAAVGMVAGVALSALVLNPRSPNDYYLGLCVMLASATAVQAVSSQPRDLVPALLFALVPVAGLVSDRSPTWLGPVFAAILLLAGEISAWIWEGPTRMAQDGSLAGRVREAGILAATGLGLAALLGAATGVELLGGTWAVLMGAAGVWGITALAFPRASNRHVAPDEHEPEPS